MTLGGRPGSIAKLTLFLTNSTDIALFCEVRQEFISYDCLPAMSVVQVAALVRDDLLLELEAIAVS